MSSAQVNLSNFSDHPSELQTLLSNPIGVEYLAPNLGATDSITSSHDYVMSPSIIIPMLIALTESVEQLKQSQTRIEKQNSELPAIFSQLLNEAFLKQQNTLELNQRLPEELLRSNTLTKATSIRQQQPNRFASSISQSKKNTSNSRITERFPRPVQPKNYVHRRSSVSDESISDSNPEISSERINKDVSKNSSLPSREPISTSATIKPNKIQYPITNNINCNDQSLVMPDAIDTIRLEKTQGKIQISQWCFEINTGSVEEIPASIHANDQIILTDTVNSSKTKRKKHEKSRSNLNNLQNSSVVNIFNRTPLDISNNTNASNELCLLHPLHPMLKPQTDRSTKLQDILGNTPALIVCGPQLPEKTTLRMGMTTIYQSETVYSSYQLEDQNHEKSDSLPYTIGSCLSQNRIPLEGIKIWKTPDQKPKHRQIELQLFPSDRKISADARGSTRFVNEHGLKNIYFSVALPDNINSKVLCSNVLSSKEQKAPTLDITILNQHEKTISFDSHNRTQFQISIQIPEMFHCTLSSNYKWLEIAIINNNKLSDIYSIHPSSKLYYIPIKEAKFPTEFEIIKSIPNEILNNPNVQSALQSNQIITSNSNATPKDEINSYLSKNGLNKFQIQIRLLHCEELPDQSSESYNQIMTPWFSPEFTENIESINNRVQSSNFYESGTEPSGQKRSAVVFDMDRDYPTELPCCKAPRSSDYNCS